MDWESVVAVVVSHSLVTRCPISISLEKDRRFATDSLLHWLNSLLRRTCSSDGIASLSHSCLLIDSKRDEKFLDRVVWDSGRWARVPFQRAVSRVSSFADNNGKGRVRSAANTGQKKLREKRKRKPADKFKRRQNPNKMIWALHHHSKRVHFFRFYCNGELRLISKNFYYDRFSIFT